MNCLCVCVCVCLCVCVCVLKRYCIPVCFVKGASSCGDLHGSLVMGRLLNLPPTSARPAASGAAVCASACASTRCMCSVRSQSCGGAFSSPGVIYGAVKRRGFNAIVNQHDIRNLLFRICRRIHFVRGHAACKSNWSHISGSRESLFCRTSEMFERLVE